MPSVADVVVAQVEVLAAVRCVTGASVVWPWDRLGDLVLDEAQWTDLERVLERLVSADSVVLDPATSIADLIAAVSAGEGSVAEHY